MRFDRRNFLAATAATGLFPAYARAAANALRPEQFGARGDGVTNDTAAFQRLAAEINRRGGGTIALGAKRTYVVGAQRRSSPTSGWVGEPILELHHLSAPLLIIGNGARLIAQPGLRFGTFDPGTGNPVQHPMPYTGRPDLAECYRGMVWVHDCRAPIEVRDLELDGNVGKLRIGGKWGDKGWQIGATGLLLTRNLAAERVANVYSHHHATDGAMIVGLPARSGRTTVARLISRYNGRQGLSITGGHGYDLADCEFSHTGRGPIHSAPGAGVDIEAEHPPIRDLTFTRCRFVDNAGCGMVADSGDSADAHFTDCLFVGTTSWSAWPKKPGFRFGGCTFVGSLVHVFADSDPGRTARFTDCTFTDDPKLSPTGQVYAYRGGIVKLGPQDAVEFDRCTFNLVADGVLPWSAKAIYRDCTMRQHSSRRSGPRGTYLGQTTIIGPVDLTGSDIEGRVTVNGRELPRGHLARRAGAS